MKSMTTTNRNGTGTTNGATTAATNSPPATAATSTAAAPAATPAKPLDPAVMAQIAAFRAKLQASIGEVVLAMAHLPRYRNQSLRDIIHSVVEPMTHDRIAIAKSAANESKLEETAGILIWANVSADVDAKIREQKMTGEADVGL